ncbi:MAG: HupE/UreJ family protein, partial [Myxococcales bacterium]
RSVLSDVLRTVTAFTIAHSLTLALSAAHWVVLPSRFVESAIAASIILAALNNLFPVLDADRSLAFGLGLLHGFGFAAVLADVGLSGQSFVRTLFGFNLGVEIGQLAVVGAMLPVLHLLRGSRHYPKLGLPIASTVVMLVACVWLVERAFNLRIIS